MESVDFEDNPALCHEEQKVDIGIYERVDSRAESICKEGVQVSQARNTTGFCVMSHIWSLEYPILVIFEAL